MDQNPQILLLDEPTSALDLSWQIDLLDLLQGLAREPGLLILAALHDVGHALRFADAAMAKQQRIPARLRTDRAGYHPGPLRQVFDGAARAEPGSKGLPHLIVEGRAAASA